MKHFQLPKDRKMLFWSILSYIVTTSLTGLFFWLNYKKKLDQTSPQSAQPFRSGSRMLNVAFPEEISNSFIDLIEAKKDRGPEFNWDVLGIASLAISLAGASIFYISGWVYEAHWFGFYGIHLSQVDISPPLIMIRGVPGIIIFVVAVFLAQALFAVYQSYKNKVVQFQDIPFIILFASFIASIFLSLLFVATDYLPYEVLHYPDIFIPLLPSLVVFFVSLLYLRSKMPSSVELVTVVVSSGTIRLGQLIGARLQRTRNSEQRHITEDESSSSKSQPSTEEHPSRAASLSGVFTSIFETLGTNVLGEVLERVVASELGEDSQPRLEKLEKTLKSTARFSLGLILLFAFLTSIAFSALMGEIDARRGARTLDGNWKLNLTYLHSDIDLQFAPKANIISGEFVTQDKNVYGPFGLIAVSDKDVFLTDWDSNRPFTTNPNLYVVPNSESSGLQLFMPAPTVTPTPYSNSTSIPAQTSTP